MLKLTLKNLAANKARLSLTGLAVVLGVGFVVASFITSDGLRDSFGSLSQDITSGSEITLREADEFGVDNVIDETVMQTVVATEGVARAEGTVDGMVQPVRSDGTVMTSQGPPLIGFSWAEDTAATTIIEGTAPSAGQFVLDVDTAEGEGFVVGETYSVLTSQGSYEFELSGIFRFGEENATLGAVLSGFELEDARTILGVPDGQFHEIAIVTTDGLTASEVEANLTERLPSSVEVVNQQTVEEETAAEFNEAISVIENVFLGFAGVSLFVSIFIIYNTFGVVLAQRVKEIGLLRSIGAESKQIRRGIVAESFIVGFIASAVGVLAGIGLHKGLLALFDAIGAGLPEMALIIEPATVIVAMAVGIITTMISAITPALRAGRVSPIAALTGGTGGESRSIKRRVIVGLIMSAAGVALGVVGFQGVGGTAGTIAVLAGGAMLVFFGVTLLSPLAARPVIAVLSAPMGVVAGTSGDLAGKNAIRNPRRTATTAAALMIGLSLITAALVVGASLKGQLASSIESATSADYVISNRSFDDFPLEVADDVAAVDEVENVLPIGYVNLQITPPETANGDTIVVEDWYGVADLAHTGELFDLGVTEGSLDSDVANGLVLPERQADEYGMAVGDTALIEFTNGTSAYFELVAIYTDETIVDGGFLATEGVETYVELDGYSWIALSVASGVSLDEAGVALDEALATYPQLEARSGNDYLQEIEGEIDTLMNMISLMLGLAIIIALLGIGLTLALSIVERTREIGLLRAVGMTRRQTRRMIRWEAAAIAMFGAVLGVATGLLFGWGAVQAIPDSFLTAVEIPYVRLAVMVAIAGFAGVIAAILPARRAGKLDVLDAIATG